MGIGMMLIGVWAGLTAEMTWILCAALLVGLISFLDDRRHIPVRLRLGVQLCAAVLLLLNEKTGPTWWPDESMDIPFAIAWVCALLFVIWMTNLYNFMDGMDGFAGGMTVFGFGTMGLFGHLAGNDYYAVVCWVIAAAAAGFLVWNFPPARIFMGDVGSSSLGLLAAALSLWADRAHLFPLWLAVLVFAPFVFDATVTLIRRTLQGERIWKAHRNHYYQRLVQAGLSHRRTVLWEYGLMLLCSAVALIAFHASTKLQWILLGSIMSLCLLAITVARRIERKASTDPASETIR
jgi:UDP-N-acetylmuramyl pentapeptide phosphotransferase/UDP-N-acetylglucosamine-1-phosphate transferase